MVAANTRTRQSAWSEVVRAARRITEMERLATTSEWIDLSELMSGAHATPLIAVLRDACNNYLEVADEKRD